MRCDAKDQNKGRFTYDFFGSVCTYKFFFWSPFVVRRSATHVNNSFVTKKRNLYSDVMLIIISYRRQLELISIHSNIFDDQKFLVCFEIIETFEKIYHDAIY